MRPSHACYGMGPQQPQQHPSNSNVGWAPQQHQQQQGHTSQAAAQLRPAMYGSSNNSTSQYFNSNSHHQQQPWSQQPQAPAQNHQQTNFASAFSTSQQHFTGAAAGTHGGGAWYGQPPQQPSSAYPADAYPSGGGYGGGAAETDSLKSVKDLPAPFQPMFNFRFFNPVQSECFEVACRSDTNMVVSAPTGAGKTGVMELAMLRLLSKHLTHPAAPPPAATSVQQDTTMRPPRPQQHQQQLQPLNGSHKIIYLGPIKALVCERQADWQARFGPAGLRVVQLTGDDDTEGLEDVEGADIICSTPEKFDQVTRKVAGKGSMGFFADIGLVLLDEVHLLNESGRGSSLEAGCVCRIKAVAAFPEMSKAAIASVRFVAVSATIPNIADIARWLSVPPAGLRQYGDELRPCKLTTHVKGYSPAKNDFLFERRLNDHVFTIVKDYSKGRPALVFCSSRKGTSDAAAAIVKEAEAHAQVAAYSAAAAAGGSTGSTFVRDMAQLQRLRAAAANAQAKALAPMLVAGVGFHNAAMEPADRTLVEELFKAGDLAVLCTTSTLAMGVNLPAHLVVLKGTVRWVGDSEVLPGGQPAGYQEYSQTEVLQMVGRAGRPQFDNEGVAVIMTSRDSTHRYQRLLAGQVVESCLLSTLPEHLNAEIVLGTVKDVSQAIAWIRSTFLFTRVRANPQHYGLKLRPGMTEAELDGLLREQIVLKPVNELIKYQLIQSDEDSYSLTATAAGKLMAANFLRLKTMASIVQLGERPNVPSLLRVICAAEEFKNTSLRRSEKKALNEINHAKDPEQLRYHVMASKDGNKVKDRITLPAEKLFILLNDALADKPSEALDYSLKQEQSRLMVVGQRIAKCMAKYYAERGSFASAGRSLLLTRSLRARLWEDSKCTVRQLPSIGRQLGARLAAAGLGSLRALAACGDAHQLEVAAQKPYPWGSELLAALKAHTPPPVDISMQLLEALPGRRGYSCQLSMTRSEVSAAAGRTAPTHSTYGGSSSAAASLLPGVYGGSAGLIAAGAARNASAAAAAGGASTTTNSSSSSTFSPCKLLVGCSDTDELLLLRSVVLERFDSPLQLKFKVTVPSGVNQPLNVTAMLVHDTCVGYDQKASITLPAVGQISQQQQQGRRAAAAGGSSSRTPGAAGNGCAAADSLEGCGAAGEGMYGAMEQGRMEDGYDMSTAAAAAGVDRRLQSKRARNPPDMAGSAAAAAAGRGEEGDWGSGQAEHLANGSSLGAMLPPAKRQRSQLWQPAPPGLQQPGVPPSHKPGHFVAAADSQAVGLSGAFAARSSSLSGASTSTAAASGPSSSVAARYKSVFSLGAAGLLGSRQELGGEGQQSATAPTSSTPVSSVGAGVAAATAGAAGTAAAGLGASGAVLHAADTAGELQVTPVAGADKTPRSSVQGPGLHAGATAGAHPDPQQRTHPLQPAHAHTVASAQAAAGGSSGVEQQQGLVRCGGPRGVQPEASSPVRSVGQAMSSLFDMLADDDDDDLEGGGGGGLGGGVGGVDRQQQHDVQHREQVKLFGAAREQQELHQRLRQVDAAPSFTVAGAAADTHSAPHARQQPLRVHQPLLEPLPNTSWHQAPVVSQAAGRCVSQPTDRASASAVFGAAVQQSRRGTAGLVGGKHQQFGSSSTLSLQTGLSSDTVYPAAAAAGATAVHVEHEEASQQQQQHLSAPRAPVLRASAFGSLLQPLGGRGGSGNQQQQQQLVTPPRQQSVFAGLTQPGSTSNSRSKQGRQQALSDWAASSTGSGSKADAPRNAAPTKELPDFRRFAFNAGPTGAPAATQPAAFKPSANAMLFGHLPGSRDAQGPSLQSRKPQAASSQPGSTASNSSNWRTKQQQQQQPREQQSSGKLLQGRPSSADADAAAAAAACAPVITRGGAQAGGSDGCDQAGSAPRVMPWQQFVTVKQPPAAAPAITNTHSAVVATPATAGADGMPVALAPAQQQQQQDGTTASRQFARAMWHSTSGASDSNTSAGVFGGVNSSGFLSQAASLKLQLRANLTAAEHGRQQHQGGSNNKTAAASSGPQCVEAAGEMLVAAEAVADGLYLGDIFSFKQ